MGENNGGMLLVPICVALMASACVRECGRYARNERVINYSIDKARDGYVQPSKINGIRLEKFKGIDRKDELPRTIFRYDNTDYLFKIEDGRPICVPFRIKSSLDTPDPRASPGHQLSPAEGTLDEVVGR